MEEEKRKEITYNVFHKLLIFFIIIYSQTLQKNNTNTQTFIYVHLPNKILKVAEETKHIYR